MTKNKKIIVPIIVFSFFTIYVTLINLNNQNISHDRIWVFHMLQKVANGHQMYTEINILVGPIFYAIGGFFFKIFGSNFITYDMLGGICYGGLATLIYLITKELNKHNNKLIDLLMIVVTIYFTNYLILPNYNILSIIFIMLAMLIEIRKINGKETKKSNYLIGIILGLAFFTKQTIGGMAVLATGLISLIDNIIVKKQNPIKEIIEKTVGFFIVLVPMVILMMIKGNFIAYLDLCFGSVLEFGGSNTFFSGATIYHVLMTSILLASIFMYKYKKEDIENLILILYSVSLLFYMYPIFNSYHMHVATIFIWFLIIKFLNICIENNSENGFKIIYIIPIICFIMSLYAFNSAGSSSELVEFGVNEIKALIGNVINVSLMCGLGLTVIKNNHKIIKNTIKICGCISLVLLSIGYIYNLKTNETPKGLEIYANHGFKSENLKKISNVIEYICAKEKEGYKVYGVSWDASEYFAPMNRNNNKFDLLMSGNLGYKGTEKLLEEVKGMDKVIFLKNKEEFWQEPKEIMDYIVENCEKIDELENLEVYEK